MYRPTQSCYTSNIRELVDTSGPRRLRIPSCSCFLVILTAAKPDSRPPLFDFRYSEYQGIDKASEENMRRNSSVFSLTKIAFTAFAWTAMIQPVSAIVPFGAESRYDTAEYALGTHTLNVVFIQDDQLRDPNNSTHPLNNAGEIVHWTDAELAVRRQRISDAAAFWTNASAARHHPAAAFQMSINWVNDGNPITVPDIGGEGASVGYDDALATIDPSLAGLSGTEATWRFNDAIRRERDTNWASTVFVKPYNGRASAFVNGPYVNAYEDDSSWTHAHEYGHTFGARDEYGSANTGTRSGYLYWFNSNAANLPDGSPNPDSVPSIMKTRGSYFVSEGTVGQIGWLDSDGDTVPDILDTSPMVTLDSSDSQSSSGLFDVWVSASVRPLNSPDPAEGNYTINTLVDLEYRLNGGDWMSAYPLDAAPIGYTESLNLQFPDLAFGSHTLDVRVTNSVDNFTIRSLGFFSTLTSGDFDNNGAYDCADIDALVASLVSGGDDLTFDVNGDGTVGQGDLVAWLRIAGRANLPNGAAYLFGDGNLDGVVDGTDFNIWNANKFTANAGWCGGDYNGDGFTDGSDFNRWNSNKFRSSGDALSVVPEPSGFLLASLIVLFLATTRRVKP